MLRVGSVAIALALILLTGNAVSASDADRDTTSSATSGPHLAPFLEQLEDAEADHHVRAAATLATRRISNQQFEGIAYSAHRSCK